MYHYPIDHYHAVLVDGAGNISFRYATTRKTFEKAASDAEYMFKQFGSRVKGGKPIVRTCYCNGMTVDDDITPSMKGVDVISPVIIR